MGKTLKKKVRHGMMPTELRVQARSKRAVHWIDRRGEVACGRQLDADQLAENLTQDITIVTCSVCCTAIEIDRQKDFFGRPKVKEPEPVDWGPLFQGKR